MMMQLSIYLLHISISNKTKQNKQRRLKQQLFKTTIQIVPSRLKDSLNLVSHSINSFGDNLSTAYIVLQKTHVFNHNFSKKKSSLPRQLQTKFILFSLFLVLLLLDPTYHDEFV
jgi:hypothetical protein